VKYAIATNGLSKNYRRLQALVDLTLEVPAGSIYGFLGPNGSGKTTTMRILTGLSRPSHGTAEVMGVSVTPAGRHRRHLGFLAQEPKFYRWMTGRQVLRYVGRFFGAADEKHIDDLLGRTGLGDAADRKTKTYSGGMRQRLGVAQALVGRPKLLMLDEPVSSLDPVGRAEVLALMRELKGVTTIFFSTHILDDVQRCSDYVAILDKGRLVTAAKTSDLLASFTKGQLHVVIVGEANDELALKAIPGVVNVNFRGREGDKWIYDLAAADGRAREVQRHLTRFASENGLALLGCDEVQLNLESVFLKLVGEGDG
jgi:ABC-2 type transport system ATP-binding protein